MFSEAERALLDLPAFAKLSTLMPDGSPQVTVMWFRREGDEIRMVTPMSAQKVRNLQRDPRAALLVDDITSGYRYVEMRGRIELERDPNRISQQLQRIAERYIGDRAAPFTRARDPNVRALLIFRPDHVRSYDQEPR